VYGNVVVWALLGQLSASVPQSDPSALVGQLGAARYADREAAAGALERLGRSALPALRAAREQRDLEVRSRASGLVQKIESALLTQPTRVRLDFDNTPLPEVARLLSIQTGFTIALYPEKQPAWGRQRIKLRESEPVNFWRAVDQLCETAGLQYDASTHGLMSHLQPTFTLTDGSMRTVAPVSDHGPFRVSLLAAEYRRQVSYGRGEPGVSRVPPPPRPAARPLEPARRNGEQSPVPDPKIIVQFSADLLIAAEPRLILCQRGPLQVLEACDERGNSLATSTDEAQLIRRDAGYMGVSSSGPAIPIQVPLERPRQAGQLIKKLRGMVPVTVASRRPDPLIVPLTGSAGKTFGNGDLRLTVHSITVAPNGANHTALVVSVNSSEPDTAALDREASGLMQLEQPAIERLQIEIVDTRGQPVPWFQSGIERETSRITLILPNHPTLTTPKELRFYALTRGNVTVPFEFTDIPMP
jgi:hypothetical protein